MEYTNIFAPYIDDQTLKYIIGNVLAVLLALWVIVGLSEKRRINKERKAEKDYEEERQKKIKYVHEHMDIFGIKD